MPTATAINVERLANYFVAYVCKRYQRNRHVRRVATWIGFLLKAIELVGEDSLSLSRTRQITFKYRDRRFKARFNHQAGPRGGIDILEVLPGRGKPNGDLAVRITNLDEAKDVYHTLKARLDGFIDD